MILTKVINSLFRKGLGELYVMHASGLTPVFGHIVYEKDKLVLKDSKLLSSFNAAQFKPCWESGMLGIICSETEKPWETLSFYGLEHCNVPVDLSTTRHNALIAAENQYGDKLLDFIGSVYRGYQLMMDNHFLPVVMLKQAETKNGLTGLIVSDLRAAPMPVSLINTVHSEISKSVDKNLILMIDEDLFLENDEFEKLFKNYIQ